MVVYRSNSTREKWKLDGKGFMNFHFNTNTECNKRKPLAVNSRKSSFYKLWITAWDALKCFHWSRLTFNCLVFVLMEPVGCLNIVPFQNYILFTIATYCRQKPLDSAIMSFWRSVLRCFHRAYNNFIRTFSGNIVDCMTNFRVGNDF